MQLLQHLHQIEKDACMSLLALAQIFYRWAFVSRATLVFL